MPLRAVLFDMDDTLTDWPAAIDRAAGPALASVGLDGDALALRSLWEEIRGYTWRIEHGRVVDRGHWRLLFEPQEPFDRAFPDWPRERRKRAAATFREGLEPPPLFPDALPALDQLGQRFTLGVISNSPFARMTLSRLGVVDRFASIFMCDDPFRKPHPQAFADGCRAAGVAAADAAFVGDSFSADIEGGLVAGFARLFWLDRYESDANPPLPAVRVRSLTAIAPLIA